MNEETTKSPNGESGRKEASIKYVNNSLIEKFFEKNNIKVDTILFEAMEKEQLKDNVSSGTNNSTSESNSSSAGSHTKVDALAEYKLAYLFKFGVLELAAREQTPKIKAAKIKKQVRKEEKENANKDIEEK